jgi:hypothetical protein
MGGDLDGAFGPMGLAYEPRYPLAALQLYFSQSEGRGDAFDE